MNQNEAVRVLLARIDPATGTYQTSARSLAGEFQVDEKTIRNWMSQAKQSAQIEYSTSSRGMTFRAPAGLPPRADNGSGSADGPPGADFRPFADPGPHLPALIAPPHKKSRIPSVFRTEFRTPHYMFRTSASPKESVRSAENESAPAISYAPARETRSWFSALGSYTFALVILAGWAYIVYLSTQMNAAFLSSRAASAAAGEIWERVSYTGDIFEGIILAAGVFAWRYGQRLAAVMAFTIAGMFFVGATLATVGFVSVNLADSTAQRGDAIEQRAAIEARIVADNAALAKISTTRSVDSIGTDIQAAQAKAGAAGVWRTSKGCTDITTKASGEACADLLGYRQEAADARRRDELQAAISTAEAERKALPVVTQADPQATMAATIANWLTMGLTNVQNTDVYNLLVLVLVMSVRLLVAFGPMIALAVGRGRPAAVA